MGAEEVDTWERVDLARTSPGLNTQNQYSNLIFLS